jgi:aquaporin NIP
MGALVASMAHALIFSKEGHNFGMTQISLSMGGAIAIEFILSFLLMFVIIAVATDSRAIGEMAGLAIGGTVALCALIGGPLTGASMNPARSIGPAIAAGNYEHLWLYILIPFVGAICGALVYESIRCFKDGEDDSHGCC